MNTWIEGPTPRPKSRGCFPSGCLLFAGLFLLLGAAFLGGGLFGMHYFVAATHISDVPQSVLSPAEEQETEQRWREFEEKARNGARAEVEFTRAEMEHLVTMNRGRAYLAVAAGNGHVRFSIPLGRIGFIGRHVSVARWIDELAQQIRITRLQIDPDRVLLEANGGAATPAPTPAPFPSVTPPAAEQQPTPSTNPDALTTASPVLW